MPNKAGFRPGPDVKLDNVEVIADPGTATAEDASTAFNALIAELIRTGYMRPA